MHADAGAHQMGVLLAVAVAVGGGAEPSKAAGQGHSTRDSRAAAAAAAAAVSATIAIAGFSSFTLSPGRRPGSTRADASNPGSVAAGGPGASATPGGGGGGGEGLPGGRSGGGGGGEGLPGGRSGGGGGARATSSSSLSSLAGSSSRVHSRASYKLVAEALRLRLLLEGAGREVWALRNRLAAADAEAEAQREAEWTIHLEGMRGVLDSHGRLQQGSPFVGGGGLEASGSGSGGGGQGRAGGSASDSGGGGGVLVQRTASEPAARGTPAPAGSCEDAARPAGQPPDAGVSGTPAAACSSATAAVSEPDAFGAAAATAAAALEAAAAEPTSAPLAAPAPTPSSSPDGDGGSPDPACTTCQRAADPAFVALYWVTRPAVALVVAKPSPAVRPTFATVLRWLHRRVRAQGVATYVEPSMLRTDLGLACKRPTASTPGRGGRGDGEGEGDEGGEYEEGEVGEEEDWMPGCATGVPQLLSWPAAEGDDCCSQMVPPDVAAAVDFVVVLGGDGTVLWTCHIFGNQSVPPVVPFNLGSLGFLTPFDPAKAEEVLARVVDGGFPIMLRHRLHCSIVRNATCATAAAPEGGACPAGAGLRDREWVVLNEVVIDRGMSSFLTNLECYCDGAFVTHVQGDGLIVATPTGSTAYNLAAGGSMVHPQVPGILFTPICPHSLSFRPLIFPDHVSLCVQVPANSRAQLWCSFDGKDRQALNAGDAVMIRMSAWPVPTICSENASMDWFSGVREGLHWNMRRLQAGAGQ
ncbi:NAD(H) kinase 1 [Tetrabaena socialis]|uniref:NAD(H) kinase 1 n=1 Tax=Tetrabaena socialis TaxID=47790 RepID=A0A2J8AK72_9CHLO|nr:NAD(H) kinase 1 [Tetrabaena socialis]|eukprot:PNH12911.1 NAD(H) kinase 1 [Tetrabaena socialis]